MLAGDGPTAAQEQLVGALERLVSEHQLSGVAAAKPVEPKAEKQEKPKTDKSGTPRRKQKPVRPHV